GPILVGAAKNFSHVFCPARASLCHPKRGQPPYQDAVPVERPIRHSLGTVGLTDDHTPPSCQVMPAANEFDAAAPVCGVLCRRHLEKLRISFVELPLVELPGDHEFHNDFRFGWFLISACCFV